MEKGLLTSVLFIRNFNSPKDARVYAPIRILVGNVSEDENEFYDVLSGQVFYNLDYSNINDIETGFYLVKSANELKEEYQTDDILDLCENYLCSLKEDVYYYDNSAEDMNKLVLNKSSLEEFNNKYELNEMNDEHFSDEEDNTVDLLLPNIKEVSDELKKSVLFQDHQIEELLTILYQNLINESDRKNIILTGPSGVGKTETLKQLQYYLNVPILISDFMDIETYDSIQEYYSSLIRSLYYQSNCDFDAMKRAIVVIDNVDYDVAKSADTFAIMSLMDEMNRSINGQPYVLVSNSDQNKGVKLDLSTMTFILCGRFNHAIVKSDEQIIDIDFFNHEENKCEEFLMNNKVSKELLFDEYFPSEKFIDSFSKIIEYDNLDLEKLKQILLRSSVSTWNIMTDSLGNNGIKVNPPTEALVNSICKLAYKQNRNAKDLNKVVQKLFDKAMFETVSNIGNDVELSFNDNALFDTKGGYQLKKTK